MTIGKIPPQTTVDLPDLTATVTELNYCDGVTSDIQTQIDTKGGSSGGTIVVADHGTAATDEVVNVSYGTGAPGTASDTTIGSLYVKYVA